MSTENYKLLLPYNLQFFAKDGPGGEKTEPATNKKLDETRKQGQVAKSKELIMAATLMALFIIVKVYVSSLGQKLMDGFKEFYSQFEVHAGSSSMGYPVGLAASSLQNAFMNIITAVFPVLIVAVIIAVLGNMLQQRWMVAAEPMKPKFSKLSPVNGFKRIFSARQLFELLKSISMIIVIGIIVYTEIKDKVNLLLTFYNITLYQAIGAIGEIVVNLGIKISAVFLVIGFIDLFYQRHKFKQDTMMTKQEIKDEFKNAEGDPQVKGQIRRRMQEISRRRMICLLAFILCAQFYSSLFQSHQDCLMYYLHLILRLHLLFFLMHCMPRKFLTWLHFRQFCFLPHCSGFRLMYLQLS